MTTEKTKVGIEAFPLSWPEGWPRRKNAETSSFSTPFVKAREHLFWEVQRMGGRAVILSTNIPLLRDGMPRANYRPSDPAVAVYFARKGKDAVFACDKYRTVADNIWAIVKTIEALRGIERWGASEMMERAFSGFARLPDKAVENWRAVLEFKPQDQVTLDLVESRFRQLAKSYHPDMGLNRDPGKFQAINEARQQARAELTNQRAL